MIQQYFCESCRYAGQVSYRQHDDVSSVLNSIRANHSRNSPDCQKQDGSVIRVRNPEMCTDAEWQSVVSTELAK